VTLNHQDKPRTTVEAIRLEIARRIVSGDVQPGAALDETGLANEFDVSRTPVREALRQLASSGLVEQRAHRSAIVTKPDEETLAGMFAVMGHLEGLCARLCAILMRAPERHGLEAMHDAMGAMVRAGDKAAYTIANDAFHGLIYDGARNGYLAEITRATRMRVQPFRRAQFEALGRLAASHAEHGEVVEAILRGNGEAAESAMRAHLGLVEDAWRHLGTRFHADEETKARHPL
jgi:DNA-binding GntR family transcriptional regulator